MKDEQLYWFGERPRRRIRFWHVVVALMMLARLARACAAPTVEATGPGLGLGICHWCPTGLDSAVGWCTETSAGRGILWRELEPQPGVYDFSRLDAFLDGYAGQGRSVWLAIQTVGADMYGVSKAPQWLQGMGARWHSGSCRNGDGLFAPWDTVYRQRLRLMLQAVNSHISSKPLAYRRTIGGIVAMSGGMYGELQLWSCGMEAALHRAYGYGEPLSAEFVKHYTTATRSLIDDYFTAFPGWPVMVQIGYGRADWEIVSHVVQRYGDGAYIKWAGLDPTNVGDGRDWVRQDNNQRMVDLYRAMGYRGHFGFETGHDALLTEPERFTNVMNWALLASAEFMCVPIGGLNRMMQQVDWRGFDAALQSSGSTAATPTATRTPTATATRTPTATTTPTRTAAYTPTPTATRAVRLQCECSCWEVEE